MIMGIMFLSGGLYLETIHILAHIYIYVYVYIYIYAGHHDFLLLYKGGASIGITTSIIDSMCIYIYCIIYHLICIYYISEILVVMVVIKRLADVE